MPEEKAGKEGFVFTEKWLRKRFSIVLTNFNFLLFTRFITFLDASLYTYMRGCDLVDQSVGWSLFV